ncbi:MAG TPA: hypothetical protein VF960_11475 [Chloroflexota bacterium]
MRPHRITGGRGGDGHGRTGTNRDGQGRAGTDRDGHGAPRPSLFSTIFPTAGVGGQGKAVLAHRTPEHRSPKVVGDGGRYQGLEAP